MHFPLPTDLLAAASTAHDYSPARHGRFRPLINQPLQLEDVRSAYEYVLTGQKLGNVILDVP